VPVAATTPSARFFTSVRPFSATTRMLSPAALMEVKKFWRGKDRVGGKGSEGGRQSKSKMGPPGVRESPTLVCGCLKPAGNTANGKMVFRMRGVTLWHQLLPAEGRQMMSAECSLMGALEASSRKWKRRLKVKTEIESGRRLRVSNCHKLHQSSVLLHIPDERWADVVATKSNRIEIACKRTQVFRKTF
jgi:hypothetical protein